MSREHAQQLEAAGNLNQINLEIGAYTELEASTTDLITVYVRSSGSDTTGDGTLANPYATERRAMQDAPWLSDGKRFRIDVSGRGTLTQTALWRLPPLQGARVQPGSFLDPYFGRMQQSDVEFYAAPTAVGSWATGSWSIAQEAVSGAAELCTITIPGASFTVNEHKGHFVGFAGLNVLAQVISNTSNTLYVTLTNVYAAYVSAVTMTLYAQSCTIDVSTLDHWFSGNVNYTVTLAGLAFTLASYSSVDASLCCPRLSVVGCKSYAAYQNSCAELNVIACSIRNYFDHAIGTAYIQNSAAEDLNLCNSNTGGRLALYSSHLTGGDSIGEGYYHGYGATYGAPRYVSCFYTVHRDTNRGGVRLLGRNQWATLGYCDFTNCGYGGLRLEWGASAYVNGPLSGTGNGAGVGGAAVYAIDGSYLQIAATTETSVTLDATNITIGGTVAQLIVGDNSAITWAQFFAARSAVDTQRTGALAQQRGTKIRQPPVAPSMTTTERDALPTQPAGAMIYNSTLSKGQMFDGATWQNLW